jgi:osmoprotectant transport system ATP-binding protein
VTDDRPLAVELIGVSKHFGAVEAVNNVSFAVRRGEICVLIGPSGCGKTTTLKMINRVIEPTGGTIRVRGEDTATKDPVILRRSIGYVIQQVGLFPHMSVAENIAIALRLRRVPKAIRRERAAALLELVGLQRELLDRRPSELSGGQQQRVGVARALAGEPDIILMDEPFGAVDPLLRPQLQAELRRLQRRLQKTIVLVTHDLSEAFAVADRIVLMRSGEILQHGTPRELLQSPNSPFVREFLADVRVTDVLRLTRLRDIPRSACTDPVASPAVPSDGSLLDALRILASHSGVQPPEGVVVTAADGTRECVITVSDLLVAVAAALFKGSGT